MNILSKEEKQKIIKQIEETVLNHPISVSGLLPVIELAGELASYGIPVATILKIELDKYESS